MSSMPRTSATVYTIDEARRRRDEVRATLVGEHRLTEAQARELAEAYVLDNAAWALLDELDTLSFLLSDEEQTAGAHRSVA